MIALVTETLCCMGESDTAAYGVRLIPLSCRFGDLVCADRILTREESLTESPCGSVPPSEEAYRACFESLLADHDGVLCITASRKFSDSHRHAALAAASFGGRVVVVDSGTVAGGLFLLALRARHMITLGYPMSRMRAELESYKNGLRVAFTTDSTEVLRRAKRLRYTPEEASSVPAPPRHPVFRIENGEIGVFDLAAGNRQTVESLLQVFREPRASGRASPSRVVVHYADRSPAVEYLLTRLGELFPSATVYERPITLSIQVNLGRDIVGVVGD
jgi:DegV family protein with EDD domain